jgi:hypothetical protein
MVEREKAGSPEGLAAMANGPAYQHPVCDDVGQVEAGVAAFPLVVHEVEHLLPVHTELLRQASARAGPQSTEREKKMARAPQGGEKGPWA